MKFVITEDNAGGLTLFVWDWKGDEEKLIYAHTGYQFNIGHLSADIKELYSEDCEVNYWEGNDLVDPVVIAVVRDVVAQDDPLPLTEGEYYDCKPSTAIIAEGDDSGMTIHVSRMGRAGRKEFVGE